MRSRFLVALTIAAVTSGAGFADRPCPTDVNCSGAVDVDDLLEVIINWGALSGSADVDGSGLVDVDDLLDVLLGWGPCVFEFPAPHANQEAHQIALEMLGPFGPLLPDVETIDRIAADLAAIRAFEPSLADQGHTPAWATNRIIVSVPIGGDTADMACLNAYYQMTEQDLLFSFGGNDWFVLTFAGSMNVEALSTLYAASPDVQTAEPDGLIGGANFWVPTPLGDDGWRWNIDDGWHDCFDGCDCHHYWEFRTTAAGNVALIDFQAIGQPWCEFPQ